MSTNQQELLHTQMNVEKATNLNWNGNSAGLPPNNATNEGMGGEQAGDEQLIDREKIDGTPFWVEGNQEKGYYLRMGRHRLTIEELKTKEEAIEYINYNMYDLLLKMVLAVMGDRDEIEALKWTGEDGLKRYNNATEEEKELFKN